MIDVVFYVLYKVDDTTDKPPPLLLLLLTLELLDFVGVKTERENSEDEDDNEDGEPMTSRALVGLPVSIKRLSFREAKSVFSF